VTRSLFLGDSESFTGSAGGLGLLSSDLQVPEVTETSVLADLLHALKIFSESGINHVGVNLTVASILDASLSVQEPFGDSVLYKQDIEHSQIRFTYRWAWRKYR